MNTRNDQRGGGGYGNRPQGGGWGQQVKIISLPDFNDPELLGKKAEDLARNIADGTNLTTTQLRNFYGEVKNIERNLDSSTDKPKKWEELYPRIKLIRAKAVYNANRENRRQAMPKEFQQFLEKCIERIGYDYESGIKNFRSFCQLFEAVVGYSSAYAKPEGK
jgi:CRISPR-associated protein Csm2